MSKCTFLHWLDLCMGGGWVGGGDPGELGKVGPRLTSPLPHLSLCPVFQCGHSRERRENRDRQTDGQTGWQTLRERGKRRGRYIHTTTHTRARAERERGGLRVPATPPHSSLKPNLSLASHAQSNGDLTSPEQSHRPEPETARRAPTRACASRFIGAEDRSYAAESDNLRGKTRKRNDKKKT